MRGEEALEKLKKGMEIRLVQNFDSCFGVVDNNMVVMFQLHPLDKDRILSGKFGTKGLQKTLLRGLTFSGTEEKSLT